MAVYVDNAMLPLGRMIMCHMIADTHEELMEMARRIGVEHRHLQKAGTHQEHFDVCLRMRARAVWFGATEITQKELGAKLLERKAQQPARAQGALLSVLFAALLLGLVPQQVAGLALERGAERVQGAGVNALDLLSGHQAVRLGRGDTGKARQLTSVLDLRRLHQAVQRPADHGINPSYTGCRVTVAYNAPLAQVVTLAYNTSVTSTGVYWMLVSAMAVQDRPAHRARHLGFQALTNVELITVALGLRDTRQAEDLMVRMEGSLRRLANSLDSAREVTPSKRLVLGAALELGRRMAAETVAENPKVRSPRDVAAVMAPKLEDLPVEEMHVLILDAQHCLQRDVLVTRGILNSSLVHPREIFKAAIAESAAAIILVHNHPSGDPSPSADDRNVTDQLVAAGRLLDIPVHDHIIIGRGRFTSFAETGLL